MSFGQKPSNAWARQPAPQGQQLNPNLFTNQLPLGAQFAGQVPGMGLGPGINALVNTAAFNSNLNMNLIGQARQLIPGTQQQQPQRPPSPQAKQPNQRTFVGTVTKLMDTYGFVDEDVFFQTSVIRGKIPRVGDRVMVDATFNASMPFKWNAYRIQLIQEQPPPVVHQPPPNVPPHQPPPQRDSHRWGSADRGGGVREEHRPVERRPPQHRRPSPRRERSRSPNVRRSSAVRSLRSPSRKSPPRRPDATLKRERERSPRSSREPRAKSPQATKTRDDSPPRRRQRIIPRYQCYVPKPQVNSSLTYSSLHKRYPSLYVPSDFVRCDLAWPESFNLEEPITFAPNGVQFHVLSKDIDCVLNDNEKPPEESPSDADPRYTVKVLLLSHPGGAQIRQKVTGLLADGSLDEAFEVQGLNKILQAVCGCRGKSEYMGVGGPWSPSLDGADPLDPQTIIKTAIRTVKAQTGVDLTKCPTWYKMAQLRYHRSERNRKDTVVLMLPDVSATPGLQPDSAAYKQLTEGTLAQQLKDKLAAIDADPFQPSEELLKKIAPASETPESQPVEAAVPADPAAEPVPADAEPKQTEDAEPKAVDEDEPDESAKPKHWSQINVKTMKVAELREQLEIRGLDCKGVKNALAQRLQEALNAEEKAEGHADVGKDELIMTDEVADVSEETKAEDKEEVTEAEIADPAPSGETKPKSVEPPKPSIEEHPGYKKELAEFEKQKKERKQALERQYQFPKEPCVFVYPSKTAKAGKFNCKVASVQSLLDYRIDDNKEASFEVFLFAEALKEAIDRSFAFTVFHVLNAVLEKDAEKKRRDDELKKDETQTEEAKENGDAKSEEKSENKDTKDKESKESDPRANFKALVHDLTTFQAFAHFDQNICGYINDRDLEEIVYSIGLSLSRCAIQKVIKKVSARDRFNYRNVTDKWVDKEGVVKYVPEPCPEAPTRADLLAEYNESTTLTYASKGSSSTSTPDVTQSGVVFFKGTLLNIIHTLEQQRKIEAEQTEALLKIEQLEQQLKTMKDQRDRYDKKRKHLEEDLEKNKKRLHDAEKCLKNTQDDTVMMKTSLLDLKKLGEKVVGIVDKVMPPPKKERKDDDKKEKKDKENNTPPNADNVSSRTEKETPKKEKETGKPAEKAEATVESVEKTDEANENTEEEMETEELEQVGEEVAEAQEGL